MCIQGVQREGESVLNARLCGGAGKAVPALSEDRERPGRGKRNANNIVFSRADNRHREGQKKKLSPRKAEPGVAWTLVI